MVGNTPRHAPVCRRWSSELGLMPPCPQIPHMVEKLLHGGVIYPEGDAAVTSAPAVGVSLRDLLMVGDAGYHGCELCYVYAMPYAMLNVCRFIAVEAQMRAAKHPAIPTPNNEDFVDRIRALKRMNSAAHENLSAAYMADTTPPFRPLPNGIIKSALDSQYTRTMRKVRAFTPNPHTTWCLHPQSPHNVVPSPPIPTQRGAFTPNPHTTWCLHPQSPHNVVPSPPIPT